MVRASGSVVARESRLWAFVMLVGVGSIGCSASSPDASAIENNAGQGGSATGGSGGTVASGGSVASGGTGGSDAPEKLPGRLYNAVIGYWEAWAGGQVAFTQVPADYTVICVSFAGLLPDGSLTWPEYTADRPSVSEIRTVKDRGQTVLLSIGGAGETLSLTTQSQEDRFVATAIDFVETGGYDGIDIDIENGLTVSGSPSNPGGSVARLISALHRILEHFGPDFVLTFAPETIGLVGVMSCGGQPFGTDGTWGNYLPFLMDPIIAPRISSVHMQHYNTGCMPGPSCECLEPGTQASAEEWATAVIEGFTVNGTSERYPGLEPGQVAFGILQDTENYPAYASAFGSLRSTYPAFLGMMTWSIQGDAGVGWQFIETFAPLIRQ